MILVKDVDGLDYSVYFEHHRQRRLGLSIRQEGTCCIIKSGTCGTDPVTFDNPVADMSRVNRDAGDTFCKEVGRKVALTRALGLILPGAENKTSRRRFWQSYFAQRGKRVRL